MSATVVCQHLDSIVLALVQENWQKSKSVWNYPALPYLLCYMYYMYINIYFYVAVSCVHKGVWQTAFNKLTSNKLGVAVAYNSHRAHVLSCAYILSLCLVARTGRDIPRYPIPFLVLVMTLYKAI